MGKVTQSDKKLLNTRVGVSIKNKYGIRPTRRFPRNREVDAVNEQELDKLAMDGRQFYEYNMRITVLDPRVSKERVLAKFKKHSIVPETLQLCKDTQVMLIWNLDLENKLANGSRGVITGFQDDMPVVRFLNGIERIINNNIWEIKENGRRLLQVSQVPLKVAYAVSIHKVQGTSLDCTEIDVSNIFEYGQSYVALSRVKSLEGLSIIAVYYDSICAHPAAVEYYESLREVS